MCHHWISQPERVTHTETLTLAHNCEFREAAKPNWNICTLFRAFSFSSWKHQQRVKVAAFQPSALCPLPQQQQAQATKQHKWATEIIKISIVLLLLDWKKMLFLFFSVSCFGPANQSKLIFYHLSYTLFSSDCSHVVLVEAMFLFFISILFLQPPAYFVAAFSLNDDKINSKEISLTWPKCVMPFYFDQDIGKFDNKFEL